MKNNVVAGVRMDWLGKTQRGNDQDFRGNQGAEHKEVTNLNGLWKR